MESFLAALLPKLEHLGWWSYWIIFFGSFAESIPFLGSFVPGTTLVLIGGFLASQEFLDFGDLLWFVGIGAFLGDIFAYRLASQKHWLFLMEKPGLKKYFHLSKNFLETYGDASMLLGKFVGYIRGILAFLLGFTGMKFSRFAALSLAGSFLWAATFLSLGYFFGEAWRQVTEWTTRFGVFMGVLLFSIFLASLAYRHWLKKGEQISSTARALWEAVKAKYLENAAQSATSAWYGLFHFLKKRATVRRFSGLPLTIFSSGVFLFGILLFLSESEFLRQETGLIDSKLAVFLFGARDDSLTPIFRVITFLGGPVFLFGLSVCASAILLLRKKFAEALALWSAFATGAVFLALSKLSIGRMRPSAFESLAIEHTFSFPSGHTLVSTVVYGMIAYFAVRGFPDKRKKILATFSFGYGIFLIGLSRLYLGVHYLSGVLAGLFAGLLWLGFGIAVFEWLTRRERK